MTDLLHHSHYRVEKPGTVRLKDFRTDLGDDVEKKELKERLEKDKEHIIKLQDMLYSAGERSLLLVFQAMDASGKDSCIRHVMSGVNPQGCSVWSFKAPNSEELAHDFLWRHAKAMPVRGHIGIHNRSHYEEVLVVKVHPEYVLNQNIAGVNSVKDLTAAFWEQRYMSIRAFEQHLAAQGVVILKFFLHMSKPVQKERFMERIEDADKNWKFSLGDVRERGQWDVYQKAYAEAIGATAAPHAPWFIVPADDQWESRAIVSGIVREQLEAMKLRTPAMTDKGKADLAEAKRLLQAE